MNAPLPLLAPWHHTPNGIAIESGTPERAAGLHVITTFGQVRYDGASHWSLIVAGDVDDKACSFYLHEEDMAPLEKALACSRYDLGGCSFVAAGATAKEAIAAILLATRRPLLQDFVPRLAAAIVAAINDDDSVESLCRFLESDPWAAPAMWWLAQAFVGRGPDGPSWNESAKETLQALVGAAIQLSFQPVKSDISFTGVAIDARRTVDEHVDEVALLVNGEGRVAVRQVDGWMDVPLLSSPAVLVDLGLQAAERGDTDEAITLLSTAAAVPRVDPVAFFHLAEVLSGVGRADEALVMFERASPLLEGRPQLLALLNAASLLGNAGQAAASKARLQQAVEAFPHLVESWYALGLAQVKAGDHAAAIVSMLRALEIEPAHENAHYAIACAYALHSDDDGDTAHALQHIERALASQPALAPSIADDDDFTRLRTNPQFIALVSR